jgi:tetratricopeptide (TPR) repeat protein
VNPNNAKLYNNIGHYYERLKNYSKAYEYFELASSHQSDDLGSQINIARTLINLGEEEKAERLLWKIKPRVKHSVINKRIIPNYLNLWINLANILVKNEDRLEEAENVSQNLLSLNELMVK